MNMAARFRQASERFNSTLSMRFGNVLVELGERVWSSMLAENATDASGREHAIWWRCKDAGYEGVESW